MTNPDKPWIRAGFSDAPIPRTVLVLIICPSVVNEVFNIRKIHFVLIFGIRVRKSTGTCTDLRKSDIGPFLPGLKLY